MNQNSDSGAISDLLEELIERFTRLRSIFRDDLISRETLATQILELIQSPAARRYWNAEMKPDANARRLLIRLEDPARWRVESSKQEAERLNILFVRLADILLTADEMDGAVLELLLDTADLPHFASFVDTGGTDVPYERGGVELSVLD